MISTERKLRESSIFLKEIEDFLSDKENWGTGFLAKKRDGTRCKVDDPQAACFCVRGAIKKVVSDKYPLNGSLEATLYAAVDKYIMTASFDLFGETNPAYVNDFFGYESVMKMVKKARSMCSADLFHYEGEKA